MITKKKRRIMHECSNTTVTVPVMLMEMYDVQIREYGYMNKSEVLTYLAVGLWNEENGIANSRIVRSILSRVTRQRAPVFQRCPRRTFGISLSVKESDKILSLSRYDYLSNLINAVMEAFLAAGRYEKRMLRKEMHSGYVKDSNCSYYLQTYISDDGYDRLCRMAYRGGMTLAGLLRATLNTALITEELIPETRFIPFEVQDAIQDSLRIEGFTLYHFSREVQIRINIADEMGNEAINRLIHRYDIPGANELLRRVLLFLLDANNIPYQRTSDYPEENEEAYFDESEIYVNERLSRKDFVMQIYSK